MTRDEINKLDKHLTNLENNWLDNEYENYQESGLHELEWTDAKSDYVPLKEMPTDDLQESNYKDLRALRDFVNKKKDELNKKVHTKYIDLYGNNPENHSVRVDKDKLTIVADNLVVAQFKDWAEMEQWLKYTDEHNKKKRLGVHNEINLLEKMYEKKNK